MSENYVHGYRDVEGRRLEDQAEILVELLHADTAFPAGSQVLELGCGVGAQTVTLARRSPDAQIAAVDVSADSVEAARRRVTADGHSNVSFHVADVFDLPFAEATFDAVFVCFVLEHLDRPADALRSLRRMLRPDGTLTVIEGDHGSAYFHPRSAAASAAIDCLVALQRTAGGNALIGRELYPLLTSSGFADVAVRPLTVYADASRPRWVDGFTLRTFTAMVAGVRQDAITAGLVSPEQFDDGVAALERTAADDGVFNYTFFKATARREA